ncbi:acyl-CoA dehydrogenase NM domain-like protein [Thelephora ganbajun]|uniref:Acyl-CoA dehydrogenase NM domain-like protein n=1 Tax=Thelephora ganbajun TaxID=370292 RepID=A0ACB6ZKJ5_THEGA|nr:acyl-CoA dehydrogenase NM domain-like protein [Thelephora ganbajun]
MHLKSVDLSQTELFQRHDHFSSWDECVHLSYKRARSIGRLYDLTAEDILHVSTRYLEFHTDPILLMDGSVPVLLTIHCNLYTGTLVMFAPGRPDVQVALDKALRFETFGNYFLTELDHGLDVINLETTATLKPDGSFDLHTPHRGAAKFMPPSIPCGILSDGIVFARLLVDGEDRGVKPFVVPIHDGHSMYPGITAKRLSPRGSSNPVNHALTYFNHVRLSPTALLTTLHRAMDPRAEFFHNISRVVVGTLSMAASCLPGLRIISYIAGKYSLRRKVTDASTGLSRPIISFSTQYIPVMTAIADAFISIAFVSNIRAGFGDPELGSVMKHFLAAVTKVTLFGHTMKDLVALADRCGAQGLLRVNQLDSLIADARGSGIAEGDILGISVRFAIDLALGRIAPPRSSDPESRLAHHEAAIISQLRSHLFRGQGSPKEISGSHRRRQIEAAILPLCVPLMQAVGHRMAYDAAIEASVDPTLIDIYLSSAILSDPAWYSETSDPAVHLSRSEQLEMQLNACTKGVARLEEWLDKLEVGPYVLAPIVSEEKWDAYEQTLETFGRSQDPSDDAYLEDLDTNRMIEEPQSTASSLCFLQSGSMAAKL